LNDFFLNKKSTKTRLKGQFLKHSQLIKQPLKRSKYNKAIKILEAYLSQTMRKYNTVASLWTLKLIPKKSEWMQR
jgi:hypothetical protein